ncbi:hypothetical protein FQN54_009338 [Arachnomyces sp. PD_36]|nr:hypothetical protein FQN54_009338 [Arachnomyces sp. PD_36]
MAANFARFLNNSRHADTTVHIYDFELPVHSVILAAQSDFFDKAFDSQMKECQSKSIHFNEGSAHAYWRVFEYIYTGNYTEDPSPILEEEDNDFTKDLRVYVLADMFLMEKLKEYAFQRFKAKIQQLWMSDMFIDCIKEVYNTCKNGDRIRGAVVEIAIKHICDLWKKQQFHGLVHQVGDFAEDLIGEFPETKRKDSLGSWT